MLLRRGLASLAEHFLISPCSSRLRPSLTMLAPDDLKQWVDATREEPDGQRRHGAGGGRYFRPSLQPLAASHD